VFDKGIGSKDTLANPNLRFALYQLPAGLTCNFAEAFVLLIKEYIIVGGEVRKNAL
jgi:hypothetical protein